MRESLLLVSVVSLVMSVACDDASNAPQAQVTAERSQAVLAAPGAPTAIRPSSASKLGPEAAAGRKGELCSTKPGGKLPTGAVGGLGGRTAFAGGKPAAGRLTWVNLWAAWCEPCKKELPLLREFRTKLASQGVPLELAFFSIDDDERQLKQFLIAEPADGLGRTFWLREGKERDEWLADVKLPADPRLPVHLLVAPDGEIFCRIEGSIEPSDFEAAAKLLSAHR